MSPKSYRRGYPVAVLMGIERNQAVLWQVFSQVAKHQENIMLNGDRNDSKSPLQLSRINHKRNKTNTERRDTKHNNSFFAKN